jgi:hypothetical protein
MKLLIPSKMNVLPESSEYLSRVPQSDVGRQDNILLDLRRRIGGMEVRFVR